MFNIFKKKKQNQLMAPVDGTLVKIEDVSDEVFSTKVMGDGFAIKPSSDMVVSPIAGEITNIFPTKHAISITSDNGLEILLHLGIDTVELNGEPFDVLVQQGQKVSAGDKLVKIDRNMIKEKGKDDMVILVVPNNNNISFDPDISSRNVDTGELVTEF
jgi:PTS system glucose-specific IIA component